MPGLVGSHCMRRDNRKENEGLDLTSRAFAASRPGTNSTSHAYTFRRLNMNVCFVALSYPVDGGPSSGVSTQVRVLAKELVGGGHSVSIVTLGSNKISTVENDGI